MKTIFPALLALALTSTLFAEPGATAAQQTRLDEINRQKTALGLQMKALDLEERTIVAAIHGITVPNAPAPAKAAMGSSSPLNQRPAGTEGRTVRR
jgi:hypothetical protein